MGVRTQSRQCVRHRAQDKWRLGQLLQTRRRLDDKNVLVSRPPVTCLSAAAAESTTFAVIDAIAVSLFDPLAEVLSNLIAAKRSHEQLLQS